VLEIAGMMRASVRPATLRMNPATLPIRPVLSRPAPMIMTATGIPPMELRI